ncbi:cupin domain-containing protein [Methylomonas sp. AM2-LC]|uniref:cupin domain-containing protein n=1 Tax=Methylomonas sp. AM2-LC TaxID=3153301 RepID=UPI003267759E
MKFINKLLYISILVLLSPVVFAATDDLSASTLSRHLLLKKRVTLSANSIDSKVIRVQFPQGYKTPVHTHEGAGPRYVVKGKLRVEEGAKNQVFSAGEVFWETGEAMTVENVGTGEAEIIIFEMAPVIN